MLPESEIPYETRRNFGFCISMENGEGYVYRSSERSCIPSEPFLDLPQFIFSQGHQHSRSNKAAFIDAPSGRRVNFGELQRHVELAAGALARLGVHRGDVVGLVAPNSVEYGVLALAIMSMGAVVCPCNPSNTAAELSRQLLVQAEAKLVITRHDLVDKMKQLELPLLLIQEGGGGDSLVLRPLRDDTALHSGESFSAGIRQEDTAVLLFSSGTTGLSKAVVLSHANLIAATLQYEQEPAADDVFLLTTPMFHVMGFVMAICRELKRGLSILILPRFHLHKMLDAVQLYRVTQMAIVPTIFQMLVKFSLLDQYDLSSLRNFRTGGAPLGRDTMLALKSRLPHVKLRQGYGLTETSGIGTRSPLDDDVGHYGSTGILAASMEAKVVDADTGKSLPPNARGELWLRGPCIMQGYLKNPEATSSTVDAQGWFHTGDVVYFEEDGHMHVVDRIKELIKYKSFQVAPAELEELLLSHPMILDAAVVPFPDELAGEIPAAFVVRSAGATGLSASDVEEFVAQKVAPFKRIRRVTFVNSIPKLASGKILRRELIKLSRL